VSADSFPPPPHGRGAPPGSVSVVAGVSPNTLPALHCRYLKRVDDAVSEARKLCAPGLSSSPSPRTNLVMLTFHWWLVSN
jgi:hypothetical protein